MFAAAKIVLSKGASASYELELISSGVMRITDHVIHTCSVHSCSSSLQCEFKKRCSPQPGFKMAGALQGVLQNRKRLYVDLASNYQVRRACAPRSAIREPASRRDRGQWHR